MASSSQQGNYAVVSLSWRMSTAWRSRGWVRSMLLIFFMNRLSATTLRTVVICLAMAMAWALPGAAWATGAPSKPPSPGPTSAPAAEPAAADTPAPAAEPAAAATPAPAPAPVSTGDTGSAGGNYEFTQSQLFPNEAITTDKALKKVDKVGAFVQGGLQTRATPSTVVFRAIAKAAAQAKDIVDPANKVTPVTPVTTEAASVPTATTDKIAAMRSLLNPRTQLVQPQQFARGRLPEQELDAIKRVLVEEALRMPTRVVSPAWIDQNGQLQQGTRVVNGATVRGVRVANYLGDGTGVTVKGIAADELSADPPPVHTHLLPSDERWMQRVSFTSDLSDSIRGDYRYFATKMLNEWRTQWDDVVRTQAIRWGQSPHVMSKLGSYQAAVQGDNTSQLADWHLSLKVHNAVAASALQGPSLALSKDAVSVPVKTTDWQIDLVLTKRGQHQATWLYSQQLVWDVDALSLLPPDVPQTVIDSIRLGSASGVQGINTLMSREPLQFSILNYEGQDLTVSGGSQNGLRVGDTLVLVNSRELLEPVLQASVAKGLALGEVVQVGAVQSTIRQVAGSKLPMAPAGTWMAIPY
ncbi:hypothetical protein MOLA814_00514 [Betaproteobacteria bacterium MOLA814]|nr:hypothetical protein MOLA814_00514 [Betaproteobacteria bacterium MOLA814]